MGIYNNNKKLENLTFFSKKNKSQIKLVSNVTQFRFVFSVDDIKKCSV